jgi:adenylate kinase
LGNKCECGGQLEHREDDTPQALKLRLELFRNSTIPVIEQAMKEGILIEVDGERPIGEIHEDIVKRLGLD